MKALITAKLGFNKNKIQKDWLSNLNYHEVVYPLFSNQLKTSPFRHELLVTIVLYAFSTVILTTIQATWPIERVHSLNPLQKHFFLK